VRKKVVVVCSLALSLMGLPQTQPPKVTGQAKRIVKRRLSRAVLVERILTALKK
jgi:hypothetical protein